MLYLISFPGLRDFGIPGTVAGSQRLDIRGTVSPADREGVVEPAALHAPEPAGVGQLEAPDQGLHTARLRGPEGRLLQEHASR